MSEKFKKALRIAVAVGCGFEGDAEDAASLLSLIETNESRIAELKLIIDKLVEGIDSLTSEFPLEIEYIEAIEIAKDWKKGRE